MNKIKKILLGAVIALLALVIVAVIVVGLFLGKIVKAGIETVGPKLTQTSVTLDAVDISLLTGGAAVKGLVIGNPAGYRAPQAISVGMAAVTVAPTSVFSDKIIVKSIKVQSPEITLEGNPLGANNLKKILDNVNAATGGGSTATNAPAAKPAKKLEVDDLLITGAKVHLGTGTTLPIPDIHLTDLGMGPNGITPAELTKDVLTETINGALKAVARNAAELGGRLGKGAENVGKEGVNAIKKGLGGLLGK